MKNCKKLILNAFFIATLGYFNNIKPSYVKEQLKDLSTALQKKGSQTFEYIKKNKTDSILLLGTSLFRLCQFTLISNLLEKIPFGWVPKKEWIKSFYVEKSR